MRALRTHDRTRSSCCRIVLMLYNANHNKGVADGRNKTAYPSHFLGLYYH